MRLECWAMLLLQVLGERPAAALGIVEVAAKAAEGPPSHVVPPLPRRDNARLATCSPAAVHRTAQTLANNHPRLGAPSIESFGAHRMLKRGMHFESLEMVVFGHPPEHLRELVARPSIPVECCSKARRQRRLTGAVLVL